MLVVIPMAGLGSRFSEAGYKDHKPLIRVNDKTLIEYTVNSLDLPFDTKWLFICRSQGADYKDAITNVLLGLKIDYEIHWVEELTSGATETAYIGLMTNHNDYEGELIVTNCDQYLEWNSEEFLIESRKYDASVLTYKSIDEKNSFVDIVNGHVTRIVEKQAISTEALVGVHWWKSAEYFKESAEWLLARHDGSRETYVSETYNYLISEDKKIGAVSIEPGTYWSTGTPTDLSKFKGLIYEYQTVKPNTWVFDLDGTVFLHSHKYSNLRNKPTLAPGVLDTINELDSRGDTIILMSARKESSRAFTEQILDDLVVPYDHLILGVSQGTRVMVNDIRNETAAPRARAVNVIADKGFTVDELRD